MTTKSNAQIEMAYKLKLAEFLMTGKFNQNEQSTEFLKHHWRHEDAVWFHSHEQRGFRLRPVRSGEFRPSLQTAIEPQPTHVMARKINANTHEKMYVSLINAENAWRCQDKVLAALWEQSVNCIKDFIDLEAVIAAKTDSVSPSSGEAQ